jgi:phospholipase C
MNRKCTLIISLAFITWLTLNCLLASATAATRAPTSVTPTSTPIKHLVIIFQENVSFDHYFGTYPNATNPPGEPKFIADPHTPSVNRITAGLLSHNPNGNYSINPFRLDRTQAITCDMDHTYTAEQKAYNGGLLDKFVEFTGSKENNCNPKQVMGYYDGNTVTAIWNYAQHYAMNDNFYGTTFGPSTPGHINLISGQTHGVTPSNIKGGIVNGTVIGDVSPAYDDCVNGDTKFLSGKNIGDLLNAKGITWGWFHGGFEPSNRTSDGKAICNTAHLNIAGKSITDYIGFIEPFQYYRSTANPHHLPPRSVASIGYTDQANHQYDLSDFWKEVEAGNLPSVSFLKAPRYQDGHAGYSDPLDEQVFLVNAINRLQESPEWNSTAVIITWDDSDGWYDHVMPPIVNQSNDPVNDALFGAGLCGHAPLGTYQDRCGYGPRLPLLIISPWAKVNFVGHQVTDQSSILRFIEDNWILGRIGDQSFDSKAGSLMNMFDFNHPKPHAPLLFLHPNTGLPM